MPTLVYRMDNEAVSHCAKPLPLSLFRLYPKNLLILFLSVSAFAQSKQITNADVIEMIQAGLSEATVLLSIEKSPSNFDTSPKALIALKKGGATQKIMDAVMSKANATPSTIAPDPTTPPSPNPYAQGPATVFTYKHLVMIDGSRRTPLKVSPQSGTKTGTNPLTFVPGAGLFVKSKVAFKFDGARAEIRTSNPKVEFEVTVPADVKVEATIKFLRMTQKDNRREVQIGRAGLVGGSSGFRPEDIIPMNFKEIGSSPAGLVYRASPIGTFASGEYALVNGSAYLDFGVDASPMTNSQAAVRAQNTSLSDTEALINAPAEKVRTALMLNFTRQKFNLDKDTMSQLVFSKEAGGLSGNLAGIFMGKEGRNPRMILTFLIMSTEAGTLVTGRYSHVYPDGQGMGNVKESDSAKVRKQIAAELMKIKVAAENGGPN